jgi:hypothetical protein
MKRLLVGLLLVLLAARPAAADTPAQIAAALHSSPVYQAAGLDLVDVGTLTSELARTSPQVYVAVLPASAASSNADAGRRAVEIARELGESDAVVLVITASSRAGAGQGSTAT